MNETTLAQAQQALSRGDKAGARAILAPMVRSDPSDAQAWLLLSETVDDVAQKRDCLQRALRAQPDSAAARSALARLDAPTVAPTASQPAIPAAPPANQPPPAQATPEPDAFAAPLRPLAAPGRERQSGPGPVYGLPGSTVTSSSAPARKSPLSTILIGIGAGLVLGALVILGIFLFRDGRSTGGNSQGAAPTEHAASAPATQRVPAPTRRAQRPTATPDFSQPGGILASPVPGAATPTPLPEDEIPPSLPISELVPFTHEPSGITGLRPANWQLFSGEDSFQVSSSPEAPDGFVGKLVPPEEYEEQSAGATTRLLFDSLKSNSADGPAPVVTEETYADDGGGVLLVEASGKAQGSDKPFRFTIYARSTLTPAGLLIAFAIVPTELYPAQAEQVRQMVDSLTIK